jgi:hypothetical protein
MVRVIAVNLPIADSVVGVGLQVLSSDEDVTREGSSDVGTGDRRVHQRVATASICHLIYLI